MSIIDEILQHHGTKGMKWGVRKDRGHEGQPAKTKKIARLDKRFDRNATSLAVAARLHNSAAEKTNRELAAINNKPIYKNADFNHDSPLRQRYYKELHDNFLKNLNLAVKAEGTNASGTKKYGIVDLGNRWDVSVVDVKHADMSPMTGFTVDVHKDAKGFITSLTISNQPWNPTMMMQSDTFVDDILKHFGVRGMKWGVRRSRSQLESSPDHASATAARVKAKKGGTKALSNKELQDLITRMNLEQQYSRVVPSSPGKTAIRGGAKFATDVLISVGKSQITKLATDQAAKLIGAALKR